MIKIYKLISILFIFISLNISANGNQNSIGATPPSCNAQFSYQANGANPLLIQFTDLSTGNISGWSWNFGDGNSSSLINPSHSYSAAGNYYVTLIVNDSAWFCVDSITILITVTNSTPNCQANFSDYADSLNTLLIHFTDLSTGNIANWNWNFGDGTSSNLQNPNHIYIQNGTYSVQLSVTDSIGSCNDSIVKTVVVIGNPLPCQASFSYTANASNNMIISFTDQSQGNPYAWFWNFGDGTSSTNQHPTHTYASAGNYTVSLSITTQTCNDTTSQQITVSPNNTTGSLLVYVFADSVYLDSGMVFLYQYDSLSSSIQATDSSYATYSQGLIYYNFPNIPQGYYRAYAKISPQSSAYGQFYNTWAPNNFNWQNADSILVDSNNIWTSIILTKNTVSYPTGNGEISGTIFNKNSNGNTPASDIDVFLLHNDSSIISKTQTNTQGEYGFPNLAFGTYYIHPEITGKFTHDKKITLNFDYPTVDTVGFVIDGNQVITSITKQRKTIYSFSIYPNPFKDIITIHSSSMERLATTISIIDISGRLLWEEQLTIAPISKKNINTSKLSKGLYFITIKTSNSKTTKKIIKL